VFVVVVGNRLETRSYELRLIDAFFTDRLYAALQLFGDANVDANFVGHGADVCHAAPAPVNGFYFFLLTAGANGCHLAPMHKPNTKSDGELGLTIAKETNQTLARIKEKTGLSKSAIANIALAHVVQQIDSGKLRIVDKAIAPQLAPAT
jgi:hypothetical protein